MDIGIVGLPNVGKSSLFNALTSAGVPSENFPFTTIEPNVGIVPVRDERLDFLQNVFKSPKKIAAPIKFVDIAGLVPGASKGEGLGNKFLSHIREVDAILQVVRCFDNEDVVNVMGELDPKRDAEIIGLELIMADMEVAEKAREKFQGAARTGDEAARKKIDILTQIINVLSDGKAVRTLNMDEAITKEFNFLTAKPVLYLANTNETTTDAPVADLKAWADQQGAGLLKLNVKLESDVMNLPEEERGSFREELGVTEVGLDKLAEAGKNLLKLITFFAAGPKEAHAWHVPAGSPIPRAAGKIHSDLEKGFIRAEVYSVADLQKSGSEQALKAAGKIRMEGKDYITQDGDVVHIHFKV